MLKVTRFLHSVGVIYLNTNGRMKETWADLIVHSKRQLGRAGDLGNKEQINIEVNRSTHRLSAKIIGAILYNDCTEVNRINQDYWMAREKGWDSALIVSLSAAQINRWFIEAINSEGQPTHLITQLRLFIVGEEAAPSELRRRPFNHNKHFTWKVNLIQITKTPTDHLQAKHANIQNGSCLKSYCLRISTSIFEHVYCLQPSAADNPWLSKLLVIPRGSLEKDPHSLRKDLHS